MYEHGGIGIWTRTADAPLHNWVPEHTRPRRPRLPVLNDESNAVVAD